jgi:hypothetical protein
MSFYFLTEFFKYFFRSQWLVVKICARISKTPCILVTKVQRCVQENR